MGGGGRCGVFIVSVCIYFGRQGRGEGPSNENICFNYAIERRKGLGDCVMCSVVHVDTQMVEPDHNFESTTTSLYLISVYHDI